MSEDIASSKNEGAKDESSAPAPSKLLQLRKARFRGASIPFRSTTSSPKSHSRKSSNNELAAASRNEELGLVDTGKPFAAKRPSDDIGILQEIANSSMRKIKSSVTASKHSAPTNKHQSPDIPPVSDHLEHQLAQRDRHHGSRKSSTSKIPNIGHENKSECSKSQQATSFEHSPSNETMLGYTELQENEPAEADFPLESLASSAANKSQSVKIRNLSSEVKTLRQQVEDWASKFDERVNAQLEKRELVVNSLRAKVQVLKKSSEVANSELEDLRAEIAEKNREIEATDLLNRGLERRLDFMSDMLATSPSRAALGDGFKGEFRRNNPKPTTRVLPVTPNSLSLTPKNDYDSSPQSPTQCWPPRADSLRNFRDTSFHGTAQKLAQSVSSDTTLVEDFSASPDRWRWSVHSLQPTSENKVKPARRMRRFNGSVSGPRALILPSTTYNAPFSLSAPATAACTPTMPIRSSELDVLSTPSSSSKVKRSANESVSDSDGIVHGKHLSSPIVFTGETNDQLSLSPTALKDQQDESSSDEDWPHSPKCESVKPNKSPSLHQDLVDQGSNGEEGGRITELPETVSEPLVALSDSVDTEFDRDQLEEIPQVYDPGGRQLCLESPQLSLPFRMLNAVITAACRAIDCKIPSIRVVFTNAWSKVSLSKPVLDFRWWLVKLLVGDWHQKSQLLTPLEAGPDSSQIATEHQFAHKLTKPYLLPPLPSKRKKRVASDSKPTICDVFRTREKYRCAIPPSVAWLKFSITLVFAVGIAIKDGPASLFTIRKEFEFGNERPVVRH